MPVTYKGFLFTIQGDEDEIRVVAHLAPQDGSNEVIVVSVPIDPTTVPEPLGLMGEKTFADWAENHMVDFVDGEMSRRNPFGLH